MSVIESEGRHRVARPPARPTLAAVIAARGRTYVDLGRAVGCAPETIGRAVKGTVQPSAALRARLAAVLGVEDIEALFALSEPIQRLVREATTAGINTSDDLTADRLVSILATATRTRRRPPPVD